MRPLQTRMTGILWILYAESLVASAVHFRDLVRRLHEPQGVPVVCRLEGAQAEV